MAFAVSAGAVIRPITASIEDGFALPSVEKFEELINTTRASIATGLYAPRAGISGAATTFFSFRTTERRVAYISACIWRSLPEFLEPWQNR